MTAFRPGASPPPVNTPMRAIEGIRASVLQSQFVSWAASSVGRAPRSQRGGREFEPPAVHQPSLMFTRRLPTVARRAKVGPTDGSELRLASQPSLMFTRRLPTVAAEQRRRASLCQSELRFLPVLNLPYTSPPSRYDEFGRPCFGELSQISGLATKEHHELTERPIADGFTTAVTSRLVAQMQALVRAHIACPCDLLEIGGGRGKLFDGFADAVRSYINVEPDPIGSEGVQRLAHPKYQIIRCSAEAIPLPDASVDGVLSMASFDHV